MEQRKHEAWITFVVTLILFWSTTTAQLRYSIAEEVNEGTVVGNVAKALALDESIFQHCIVSGSGDPLFCMNQVDGFFVCELQDRQGRSAPEDYYMFNKPENGARESTGGALCWGGGVPCERPFLQLFPGKGKC